MVDIPGQTRPMRQAGQLGGGRHLRAEADEVEAVAQYELLTVVLRRHRPGERTGLCLMCGTGWPCAEVLLPLHHGLLPHMAGRSAGVLSRVPE